MATLPALNERLSLARAVVQGQAGIKPPIKQRPIKQPSMQQSWRHPCAVAAWATLKPYFSYLGFALALACLLPMLLAATSAQAAPPLAAGQQSMATADGKGPGIPMAMALGAAEAGAGVHAPTKPNTQKPSTQKSSRKKASKRAVHAIDAEALRLLEGDPADFPADAISKFNDFKRAFAACTPLLPQGPKSYDTFDKCLDSLEIDCSDKQSNQCTDLYGMFWWYIVDVYYKLAGERLEDRSIHPDLTDRYRKLCQEYEKDKEEYTNSELAEYTNSRFADGCYAEAVKSEFIVARSYAFMQKASKGAAHAIDVEALWLFKDNPDYLDPIEIFAFNDFKRHFIVCVPLLQQGRKSYDAFERCSDSYEIDCPYQVPHQCMYLYDKFWQYIVDAYYKLAGGNPDTSGVDPEDNNINRYYRHCADILREEVVYASMVGATCSLQAVMSEFFIARNYAFKKLGDK